jgi:hypothetical protein
MYQARPLRFLRWAYQAKVIKTLDNVSSNAVCRRTGMRYLAATPRNPQEAEILYRRSDEKYKGHHEHVVSMIISPDATPGIPGA